MNGLGLQTFMRMANLYNPQQMKDTSEMPSELPTQPQPQPRIDEELTAEVEPSTLDMFRQNVLNPPQRTQMTYPKNTLAGLESALKVAATPTDYEKNRVYVGGNTYQKAKAYTDKDGKQHIIESYKQPGFMEQVMKSMPDAVSAAPDILNQPYEDAMTDWDLRNKGLSAAAQAESNMALANQRQATAAAIPQRLAQGDRALDIRLMDAETRQKLAALKDLPESEKLRLVQEGKITVAELNAANQYSIQELRGQQRTEQIDQQGNITSGHIQERGNVESGHIVERGGQTRQNIAVAGGEARTTKLAPGSGGSTASIPSQQKVALQERTQRIVNENPEWGDYISISPEGFPVIEPPAPPGWRGKFSSAPDKDTFDAIYEAIYGTERPATTAPPASPPRAATSTRTPGAGTKPATTAAPPATPVNNPPAATAPAKLNVPPPTTPGVKPIIQRSPSTNQYRISYDGGKTWRSYNPNGPQ